MLKRKRTLFIKLAIARKEANETLYWLELLEKTSFITSTQAESLHANATVLLKLLTSSIKTAKESLAKPPVKN